MSPRMPSSWRVTAESSSAASRTPFDADGNSQHAADMAAQLGLALDNLEAVLAEAA